MSAEAGPASTGKTTVAPEAGESGRPDVAAVAGVCDGLTADELVGQLRTVFGDGPARHWVAWPSAIGPVGAGVPTEVAGWCEGRVWGTRAEVRWQPVGPDRYSALYLGEGEALPDGFRALASDLRAVGGAEPEGLFLWGVRGEDGRYHDTRLPRALDYASGGITAAEPRIPCQLLVATDGQVRFIRLTLAEDAR